MYEFYQPEETHIILPTPELKEGYTFSHYELDSNKYHAGNNYPMPEGDVSLDLVWIEDGLLFELDFEEYDNAAWGYGHTSKEIDGLEWFLKETFVGNDTSDLSSIEDENNKKVLRFRGANTAYLESEYLNYVDKVTFDAKYYNSNNETSVMAVSYKLKNTENWILIKTITLTDSYVLQTINIDKENVKVRIDVTVKTANIDNLKIYGEHILRQKVAVSFDLGYEGSAAIDPQQVLEGSLAVEPSKPARTGYEFLGWFIDVEEEPFSFDTPIIEPIELIALWEELSSDLSGIYTLEVPEGTANTSTIAGTNYANFLGLIETLFNVKFEKGSSTAPAFNTDKDPKGARLYYNASGSGSAIISLIDDDYIIESIEVLFLNNNNANTGYIQIDNNAPISTSNASSTKTDTTGIVLINDSEVTIKNASTTSIQVVINKVTIVVAKKGPVVKHDVIYIANGGTPEPQTNQVAVGAKLTEPTEPTKEGFDFVGWYKEAELINSRDFENDVMPDNDITLYAKWEEKLNYLNEALRSPENLGQILQNGEGDIDDLGNLSLSELFIVSIDGLGNNGIGLYDELRIYKGTEITIKINEGYIIKKLVFDINKDGKNGKVIFEDNEEVLTTTNFNNLDIYEFKIYAHNGQIRINNIYIEYIEE